MNARRYPYTDGQERRDPNYDRVVRSLTDAELEAEILSGVGERDYRAALVAEAERRGQTPPVPS